MSSKKKSATPYHAKSTKKSGKGKPESSPVAIDATQPPVEVVANAPTATDPDRVPLSQAMKKPRKAKGGKKPAAAKSAKAPKASVEPKTKKLSGLDAAAQVLAQSTGPVNAKDIVQTMTARGLWTSPGGKTPHATLHAAISREIKEKGKESRFKKAGRGLFTINA